MNEDLYHLDTTSLFGKDLKSFQKLKNKELNQKLAKVLENLERYPHLHANAKLGDLQGFFTRNIGKDYRLMFQIDDSVKLVTLHQLNTHDVVYSTRRKQHIKD